jgi:hypothetical protein
VFVRNAQEVGSLSEAPGLSTLPYCAQGSSDSESVHDADPPFPPARYGHYADRPSCRRRNLQPNCMLTRRSTGDTSMLRHHFGLRSIRGLVTISSPMASMFNEVVPL